MMFVNRDNDGKITGAFRNQQHEGQEWCEGDELEAFLNPQPTIADLQAQALKWAREMRLEFFKVLDGLQVSALVTGETVVVGEETVSLAAAIEITKQALRNITQAVDLSALTTLGDMQNAFILEYWQIRSTVPERVQSAFNALVP